MMYQDQLAGIWPIVFLAAFITVGCAEAERLETLAPMPPLRATCDTEAQRLVEAVDIYPAPKPGLASIAKLDQGRFVYRCEQQGEWLGVMFPAMGEKVDCIERQPERPCSLGWIRRETKMEIFG